VLSRFEGSFILLSGCGGCLVARLYGFRLMDSFFLDHGRRWRRPVARLYGFRLLDSFFLDHGRRWRRMILNKFSPCASVRSAHASLTSAHGDLTACGLFRPFI